MLVRYGGPFLARSTLFNIFEVGIPKSIQFFFQKQTFQLDENGRYTNNFKTYAFSGFLRNTVRMTCLCSDT